MATTLLVVPIAIILVLAGRTYYRWYQHRTGRKASAIPDALARLVLFQSLMLVLIGVTLASYYFQLRREFAAVTIALALAIAVWRSFAPRLRRS